MSSTSEKTVLFLGGSSDIALAIAHKYAQNGFKIVLTARQVEKLEAVCSDFKVRYSKEVKVVGLDVSCPDSRKQFLGEIESLAPFNGIVCAIGSMSDQSQAEKELGLAATMMELNFTQSCLMLEHTLAYLDRRQSFIVGISSVAGDRGRKKNYFYGAAKAGFSAYLSGLRNRLSGDGVQVLTVKPGFVDTKMTKGMDLPRALVVGPDKVARDIYRAQVKGKNQIYAPWFWYWILLVIRSVPESLFKKLNI